MNPEKFLSVTLIKGAQKCIVRECDEVEKGRFVAYVDEGEATYDASVSPDVTGRPDKPSCDCGAKQPCRHVAALTLFIAQDKKPAAAVAAPKKGKPRKVSEAEALLEDTDAAALKAWLRAVFPVNKELELAFIHHFAGKEKIYTPEEAANLTQTAAKTVMGKARTPDATQMKKILELWKSLHAPIIERYKNGPADAAAFAPLHALLNACMLFHRDHQGTAKVLPYVQRIVTELVPQVAALVQDEAFEAASGFFIRAIPDTGGGVRMYYAAFIESLSEVCPPERQRSLAQRIAIQHRELQERSGGQSHPAYAQAALAIVQAGGLFRNYSSLFKPIQWSNEYNLALICALMEAGNYSVAEDIAWAQIHSNKRAEHSDQYLALLKEIYMLNDNIAGRARIAAEQLPATFDFDDYLLVAGQMGDEAERKKFRTKMFSRARQQQSAIRSAGRFAARLLAHEGAWKKMIDLTREGTIPYSALLENFPALLATDQRGLLKALLQRRTSSSWFRTGDDGEEERNEQAKAGLAQAMITAYGREHLRTAIQQEEDGKPHWMYGGTFMRYLKGLL